MSPSLYRKDMLIKRTSPKMLSDVVVIRPILIVLLVFYHAFLIFQGGWGSAGQFPEVKAYWWLDKLSYSFLLEMFVFISGYVLGYQVRMKGESILSAKTFFGKKIKRLMIPCIVFSALYMVLLGDISQPILQTLYCLVNGVGHMWFLPMLFWCFAIVWIIEKLELGPHLIFPLLLPCSICSFFPLPFRIGVSMYYVLFFYVGYHIQRNNINLESFYSLRWIVVLITSFLVLFLSLTLVQQCLIKPVPNGALLSGESVLFKVIRVSLSNTAKIVYSSVGVAMLFCLVGFFEKNRTDYLPQWVISVGSLCMGVYLLQQFILKLLYFHTALPSLVSPLWLPWVGFTIALAGSLLLSYFLRETRIGRFLIG